MKRALMAASLSTCRHRHGAVIVKSGRVLAVGVNYDRNHPSICTNPRMEAAMCAERAAIRACEGTDLNGAVLYSARITKTGQALAKPCDRCEVAIASAGIKKVLYTS